jgi:pyruvate/2-oxoglutarate/acetoin dehydrogenase E1 component
LLYRTKSHVPEDMYEVPLSSTAIAREGTDLTLIATSVMVQRAMEAADQLAQEGIEVEIVDPRTLLPLDDQPIFESVKKTGRTLIVHEAVGTGGFGGELAARIAGSEAFDYLDAPIRRLTGLDIPIPYNRTLEYHTVPQVENIVEEARKIVNGTY